MDSNKVTPYEVKGSVNYDKVISQFGVSKIDDKLLAKIKDQTGELHHFLRRDIFFAHRDLDKLLKEFDAGKPFFLYTGRAPSGPVHMGHLVPWMFTKWLQDKFGVELYFQFPDEEKFLFKKDMTFEESQKHLEENMLDVIAVGFDPKKTHFIIDTKHAGIMYPIGIKIAKHINFSTVKSVFGFENDQNIGSIFYTAMQAVPAVLPSIIHNKKFNCLIPHAIDQDPHFRISRDVIPKLGYDKPASIQCRFFPGLGGMAADGKMSSSSESAAILATDNPATVKKKVNKYAFSGGRDTVEEHRKLGGNPDIDVSYQWLTFLEEDDVKLKHIYDEYKSGKMLSGELKAILIEKINNILAEHQKRRLTAKSQLDKFILKV